MKKQRRFAVIGGAIALIMILAGLGLADAFGPKRCCGPFYGPFGGGFHRCRGFDGDVAGFALKRLDGRIEKLNLNPDQRAKYDELRARLKERVLSVKEKREKFRQVLRNELAKESPDVAALNGMMKKGIESASAALQNDLDLMASFYSSLDEGQKQKVAAGIRERMAVRDACREERQ